MIDLNLKRRRTELALADVIAMEFIRNTSAADAGTDRLAQLFANVCEREGAQLDDRAVGRVLKYVSKKIGLIDREANRALAAMARATEAVERAPK